MTDDTERGWVEAAAFMNTRMPEYEEADNLAEELPDGYRAAEVYEDGEQHHRIEKRIQHAPFWVPIAEFHAGDADYEWAEEVANGLGNGYRGVVDYERRIVYLEALIED